MSKIRLFSTNFELTNFQFFVHYCTFQYICVVTQIKELNTVVSPNKGTLKICEIESNKGIFPLFIRFPYLKNFDEIPPKSPKPRTEIGFSDHIR